MMAPRRSRCGAGSGFSTVSMPIARGGAFCCLRGTLPEFPERLETWLEERGLAF